MATLTESMARLHAEIVFLRIRRQAFRRELARRTRARRDSVSSLRGAFSRDLAGARAVWSAPPRAVVSVEKTPFQAPPRPSIKTLSKSRKKNR